jgi:hypothetical protein
VANPLNRYLINSPMLPQLEKDFDGGLTVALQNGSPGTDKEANWLPAPKGPFMIGHALLLAEGGSADRSMDRAAAAEDAIAPGSGKIIANPVETCRLPRIHGMYAAPG